MLFLSFFSGANQIMRKEEKKAKFTRLENMSKKIEKSICQRQTHRKIVFKYINEAKDIILSYDESLREKLLSIKLTVEKKKNLIENLDTDILNSIDGEVEMEKEVEDASEFETIVNELLLKIQVTIEKGSESLKGN